MTVSYSSITPGNFELTPCRVKYNGVDLGATNGGVKLKLAYSLSPLHADQYGDTEMDHRVSGFKPSVEFTLAEVNSIDNWKVAVPNSTVVGTSPRSLIFLSQVGASQLALAHQLILHPLSKADADLSGDYVFPLAAAISATEIDFGPKNQMGLKCTMNVYPDTSVNPSQFFVRGDPSIGMINASAAAAVFTGTGTGTITSIVPTNLALTETVTVMCVGIPAANKSNWLVSGSLSGVLGYCSITSSNNGGTVNFVNPKISFTITDAVTDFVIGDNWTIAVTGANYV